MTSGSSLSTSPRDKKPKRPYSYDESADEAPKLLDEEPVDVEESRPAEERESEESVPTPPKMPPVFEG